MSWTNPKEGYIAAVGTAAASYNVERWECGTRFYTTAGGVVFELPDSADPYVIGCWFTFDYGSDPCEIMVDSLSVDRILFKTLSGESVFLNHKGDCVTLYCLDTNEWIVIAHTCAPSLDDYSFAAQDVLEITDTTYLVDIGCPYKVLHVTRTTTDPVTISFSSAWIAQDGNTIEVKDTGLNASSKNISLIGVGGEDIEGNPAGAVINRDGDALAFQALGGALWVVGLVGERTLDAAYDGGGAGIGRIVSVDAGDVEWNLSGTNSFVVDASLCAGAADGFFVEDGTDYFRLTHGAANTLALGAELSSVSLSASLTADIDSVGVLSLNSSGAAINVGNDDVAQNINIGTAGARTIAVGSATATAITLDAVALSFDATDDSNLTMTCDSALDKQMTLSITNIGAGAATLWLDADDWVSINATGMGGGIDLNCWGGPGTWDAETLSFDATDDSNLTMTCDSALDKTLTIAVTNDGAGDGIIDIDADGEIYIDAAGRGGLKLNTLTGDTIKVGDTVLLTDISISGDTTLVTMNLDWRFLCNGSAVELPVNDVVDVDLVGFASTSIVGALNELKAGYLVYWVKTSTVLSPLTNTDTIRVGDGSTSTPSIAFQGDADTGLYRSANAAMHLIQGGVDCLACTTEGTIGLAFDPTGTPGASPGMLIIGDPTSVAATGYMIGLADKSTTPGYIPIWLNNGCLELNNVSGVGAKNIDLYNGGAVPAQLLRLGSSGRMYASIGDAALPSYSFLTATTSGMYWDAGNTRIAIATGTADRMYISAAGFGVDISAGPALIDCSGVLELNSSGGVISIGNDNVAQNINIGNGGARTITIGNSAATVMVDTNLGIDTATFGTSAASVLAIKNGTAPTTAPADTIQIFSADSSDNTATLGLYLEQAVEAGAPTLSHKVKVLVNGTEYWLGLDAV